MADFKITITKASSAEHVRQLLHLIERLAEFEELTPPDQEAKIRFERDGFQTNPPRFHAILASVDDSEPVAYAIYFDTYSTFLCRPSLYLEDLFVLPEARKAGIGKALMTYLVTEAQTNGYGRIEWTCLDWNTNAQSFYEKLGAEHLSEWLHYRMDSEAMKRYSSETR